MLIAYVPPTDLVQDKDCACWRFTYKVRYDPSYVAHRNVNVFSGRAFELTTMVPPPESDRMNLGVWSQLVHRLQSTVLQQSCFDYVRR